MKLAAILASALVAVASLQPTAAVASDCGWLKEKCCPGRECKQQGTKCMGQAFGGAGKCRKIPKCGGIGEKCCDKKWFPTKCKQSDHDCVRGTCQLLRCGGPGGQKCCPHNPANPNRLPCQSDHKCMGGFCIKKGSQPACKPLRAKCKRDKQCCSGDCDLSNVDARGRGKCQKPCKVVSKKCRNDEQCCSGLCDLSTLDNKNRGRCIECANDPRDTCTSREHVDERQCDETPTFAAGCPCKDADECDDNDLACVPAGVLGPAGDTCEATNTWPVVIEKESKRFKLYGASSELGVKSWDLAGYGDYSGSAVNRDNEHECVKACAEDADCAIVVVGEPNGPNQKRRCWRNKWGTPREPAQHGATSYPWREDLRMYVLDSLCESEDELLHC